jgi:gliding motility-associated-like protein
MEDKDYIKDLFRDKLEHLETDVRADLWSSISNNIPSSAVKTVSKTLIKKLVVGFSAATVVGGVAYVLLTKENPTDTSVKPEASNEKIIQEEKNKPITTDSKANRSLYINIDNEEGGLVLNVSDATTDSIFVDKAINNTTTATTVSYMIPPTKESEMLLPPLEENSPIVNQSEHLPLKQEDTKTEDVSHDENISTETEPTYILEDLPNIFTPNNDRINDFLTVNSEGIQEFYLIVLNASNQVVYSSSDPNFTWDGTGFNGDKTPIGDYVYFITGKDKLGAPIYKSSLLRITY